ncbi:MAG: hypothetical protein ABEJ07_01260 [Candidatus Nanohaloarchaea archaeon]
MNPSIIDLDNDKQVWAASLIAVLGALAFFEAGLLLSGNLGLLGADTKKVMSKEKVRDKVQNYVSVTSGERANATVTSIERSDQLESFYTVGVKVTAQVLNQTRTSETTVLVSRDGEYILSGQPRDLDEPKPPQPRTPTIQPQTGEGEEEGGR